MNSGDDNGFRASLMRVAKRSARRIFSGNEIPKGPFSVYFETERVNASHSAAGGMTLLEVAMARDIDLDHLCGGYAKCGSCRVEILEGPDNLSSQSGHEQMVLGASKVANGDRLACQAKILGPVAIRVPKYF